MLNQNLREIGRGSSGQIFEIEIPQRLARKEFIYNNEEELELYVNEYNISRLLRSKKFPHVVECYDFWHDPILRKFSFSMDLKETNLENFIITNFPDGMAFEQFTPIFQDIVTGIL